ncbi:MAG: hypothetical protein AAF288_14140 [Planctomycetota bacterium]
MDLSRPDVLFSGMLISLVGMAMFLYGRKAADPPCLVVGVVLSLIPWFAQSMLVLWALFAICLGGFYAVRRSF